MSDEKKKNISEATGELLSNALSPASKQFGQHIESAGKTAANIVNISVKAVDAALLPLYGLVWGADKIKEWINHDVAERLKDVPEENLITPDPSIAGPALEAMRFAGNNAELKDMFASLLATSMNSDTKQSAHPSYVEIIKQLHSDECRILKFIASKTKWRTSLYPLIDLVAITANDAEGQRYRSIITNYTDLSYLSACKFPEDVSTYIDNLTRLKLFEVPEGLVLAEKYDQLYKKIENTSLIERYKIKIQNDFKDGYKIEKKFMRLTNYGKMFVAAAVFVENS